MGSAATGQSFSIYLPCGYWTVNGPGNTYRYKDPSGFSCKIVIIKEGTLNKAVCKGFPVLYDLTAADQVNIDVVLQANGRFGGEPRRWCTSFNGGAAGCDVVKNGSDGKKYISKNCTAAPVVCGASPTTTTTTLATTTTTSTSTSTTTTATSTTSTTLCAGTFCDLGDGTVYDSATDLQWELKDTAYGSGVDPGNLHDVDNSYPWSGSCSGASSKACQPNLAAETACKAQTDMAYWASGCEQCTGGEGTCTVGPPSIATVWDWLGQVNAANYAGHNDWRLPSESGCNTCWIGSPSFSCTGCLTPSAHELETILVSPYPCGTDPCIDPIFGPTGGSYWSASTDASNPAAAWIVSFNVGSIFGGAKTAAAYVRAVRGGP